MAEASFIQIPPAGSPGASQATFGGLLDGIDLRKAIFSCLAKSMRIRLWLVIGSVSMLQLPFGLYFWIDDSRTPPSLLAPAQDWPRLSAWHAAASCAAFGIREGHTANRS